MKCTQLCPIGAGGGREGDNTTSLVQTFFTWISNTLYVCLCVFVVYLCACVFVYLSICVFVYTQLSERVTNSSLAKLPVQLRLLTWIKCSKLGTLYAVETQLHKEYFEIKSERAEDFKLDFKYF